MRAGTAIEVRDLRKSFAVPSSDTRTLADRLLGPVRRGVPGALPVLDGLTFDVEIGEFFGIVGRNGSGKSTLIRVLANIYGVDSGTVDIRGTVAPVVELGVGFNPDLSARANVVLGGVTLGLDREMVEGRVAEVLQFAGVERFAEMPLRNFSTGMRTRLAFAVSIEADPDILLLDEALAVGDGDFQDKCLAELNRRVDEGKTIILVSHSISKIRQYCDRALLLVNGKIEAIGDPDEVGLAYRSQQTDQKRLAGRKSDAKDGAVVESIDVINSGADGAVPRGERIEVELGIKMLLERETVGAAIELRDKDGTPIIKVSGVGDSLGAVGPGDQVRVRIAVDNPLTPGEYELGARALSTGPRGNPFTDSSVEWEFMAVGGHADRETAAIDVESEFSFSAEGARPESETTPTAGTESAANGNGAASTIEADGEKAARR